jgi:peptidoglycan/xylan/chitin deacetylase (PgdA/CDA1 family)
MPLTIVMYHYVRDLARSRYPRLKALTVEEFRSQLDYLERNHTFVRLSDVLQAREHELPSDAVMLTFDDGYIDHYRTVFPLLEERGIQGLFFPVAKPILEHRVLDVNKVHFILSVVEDTRPLVDAVFNAVEENRASMNLAAPSEYWDRCARPSRFDCAEVVFLKRMLQRHLPEALRAQVADRLFRKYVTADEAAFSHELYMTVEQLRTMVRCGMYVGCHSYSHYWMDSLSASQQREDIRKSLQFLVLAGSPVRNWVMCYPYGACDDSLVRILRDNGCALGLTTRSAAAEMRQEDPLRLPRFDTTELSGAHTRVLQHTA